MLVDDQVPKKKSSPSHLSVWAEPLCGWYDRIALFTAVLILPVTGASSSSNPLSPSPTIVQIRKTLNISLCHLPFLLSLAYCLFFYAPFPQTFTYPKHFLSTSFFISCGHVCNWNVLYGRKWMPVFVHVKRCLQTELGDGEASTSNIFTVESTLSTAPMAWY